MRLNESFVGNTPWAKSGIHDLQVVGVRLCPNKRAHRGRFGGAENAMLSSSDAGRLMIADSLSNLKPLVRISFCFMPARL